MNKTQHELAIMVVEDHAFQRKALMHQIRGLGYTSLLEAQDGVEALAMCQRHQVDILFCDLRMPGMDGMALLRRLSLGAFVAVSSSPVHWKMTWSRPCCG